MKQSFFILLLLLASCQKNGKEEFFLIVKEWQGKEMSGKEKKSVSRRNRYLPGL